MGLFNFGKNKKVEMSSQDEAPKNEFKKQTFGSPLVKIGNGDITKPYIDSNYVGDGSYVRFGMDNLYPQLIDQMYYQSPLHSSIINYKVDSAVGGGFELEYGDDSAKAQVDYKVFLKKNKIKKLVKAATRDLVMHGRVHLKVFKDDAGKVYKIERIMPSKIRYNKSQKIFWYSDNWMNSDGFKTYPAFSLSTLDPISIFSYMNLDDSPGQDVYPLVKEISIFNWCYLDGQSGTLQKKNIERTIFGSLVIKRPKEFESLEEFNDFKKSVENKEGEVVPVLLFAADGKDNLPDVESFPTHTNDKLFESTDKRIDDKICQGHTINPILMGIERPGALGSGSDIKASFPIFEKNVVIPLREDVEEMMDDVLLMFNIKGDFKLKKYRIIDEQVIGEDEKVEDSQMNSEAPVVNNALRGLTAQENNDIYRIIRDYHRDKLNKIIAKARIMAYGIDDATAEMILNEKN